MASAQTAPIPVAMPPAPLGNFWSDTQWAVLASLLDAALTPIAPAGDARSNVAKTTTAAAAQEHEDGLDFERTSVKRIPKAEFDAAVAKARAYMKGAPDNATVAAMLGARLSDSPMFFETMKRMVSGVSSKSRNELGGLLSVLSYRSGAFVLTGFCTPVHKQPVHLREALLLRWQRGWMAPLRMAARSITALAQFLWTTTAPQFRAASGYTDVPPNWRAGPMHNFDFMQFEAADSIETLEADVVIVGSGCGGAVAAQVLATAGQRVIVVEKGYHYPQSQLPLPQATGARLLFENGGLLAATDPAMGVIAGACWGGGGTINWSVALKTPDRVRQEWAAQDQPGMAFITSPAFDESLERVCDFMGVNDSCPRETATAADHDDQSHRGRVILDGAAKLGFQAAPLPQNTRGGKPHDDGYCHLGCASAEKRGTSVSWLPAAAEAGARFIEGFHVERVLFDGDDGTGKGDATTSIQHSSVFSESSPRAVGVVGTWLSRDRDGGVAGTAAMRTQRRVVIKAGKVIVSGGSLWSPVLLKKSGLTNPQIGKNLHVHPCNMVAAYFDEETKPMDKGIITSICTSFDDLDGQFHGPRLEATCMVPYTVLSNMQWAGALDFKLAAMRYRHMDVFISLTRDRDSGRVVADRTTGQPVVDYSPSPLDREHCTEGVIGIARLCHAQGANEIRTFLAGVGPWVRSDSSSDSSPQNFEQWIARVRAAGASVSPLWGGWSVATPFASAHQMGTCRMGDDAGRASVVDPRGRVWGTQGLYVADASVLPSASGANPMVTVMAFADHIARGIVGE